MTTELVVSHQSLHSQGQIQDESGFVTFRCDGQFFGIPVHLVQDVIPRQRLTHIPLAPQEIVGAVNLRGRIVTVIDLRERLKIKKVTEENGMNIVVEHLGELFSLWVDSVGDVLSVAAVDIEKSPPNLVSHWQPFVRGVYQLKDELLLILDVAAILKING